MTNPCRHCGYPRTVFEASTLATFASGTLIVDRTGRAYELEKFGAGTMHLLETGMEETELLGAIAYPVLVVYEPERTTI